MVFKKKIFKKIIGLFLKIAKTKKMRKKKLPALCLANARTQTQCQYKPALSFWTSSNQSKVCK